MRNSIPRILLVFLAVPVAMSSTASAQEEAQRTVIEDGRRVSIEYTLSLDDGTVADTNVARKPLVYTHGEHRILEALEQALAGLAPDESKSVVLSPEQGYGVVDPELFQTVPASAVPEEARRVGEQLFARSADGQPYPVRVHELKGEEIVIDLNHPLAGQTLHFDVRIVSID